MAYNYIDIFCTKEWINYTTPYISMTKVVLTGGACAGKSALLQELAGRGFVVVPETALELLKAKDFVYPKTLEEIRRFQDSIAIEQNRREQGLNSKELAFLDRGVHDCVAYCEYFLGYVPEVTQQIIENHLRYDQVFCLDQLAFDREGFRVERDFAEAKVLHERVCEVYQRFGYTLERVPVLPVAQRADYVLQKVFENAS